MCWLLHGKVAASPNQAPEHGPDVRVYSCRMQMSASYTGAMGAPMLRLLLADSKGMMEVITTGPDSVGRTFLEGQQLNRVCFDTATHEVAFLLHEFEGDTRVRAVQGMEKALNRFVAAGPTTCNYIEIPPHELAYFRELLLRNSARTLPSKAQPEVLELSSSEWRASFLMALYFQRHDTEGGTVIGANGLAKGFQDIMKNMNNEECGIQDKSGMGSKGKSDTSNGHTVSNGASKGSDQSKPAKDRKEKPAGGASDYLHAAASYTFGLSALDKLGSPEEGAHRELQKSLLLNRAAAHIKDAEQELGSAIVACARPGHKASLETAVVSCSATLDIDPGNAKALYRQAQALVKLGLDIIAEDRLKRALKIEKGDAVMQSML
ncbi:g5941 [Coccomyxa elongata]